MKVSGFGLFFHEQPECSGFLPRILFFGADACFLDKEIRHLKIETITVHEERMNEQTNETTLYHGTYLAVIHH
jgi:hypothetical protein